MSAVNASIAPTSLDAERRSHEPSMEEILASIRRIIADDEALPVVRREREKHERQADADAARDEREAFSHRDGGDRGPAEPPRNFAPAVVVPVRPSPVQDLDVRPSPAQAVPISRLRDLEVPPRLPAEPVGAPEETEWASNAEDDFYEGGEFEAFGETVESIAAADESEASAEPAGKEVEEGEPSSRPLVSADAAATIASHFQALAAGMVISEADVIERFAQDLLRPMLRQWLDDNLPSLVERLVREEIERVARKRR